LWLPPSQGGDGSAHQTFPVDPTDAEFQAWQQAPITGWNDTWPPSGQIPTVNNQWWATVCWVTECTQQTNSCAPSRSHTHTHTHTHTYARTHARTRALAFSTRTTP